ncbi:hypothetical protein E4U21_001594 [Claviceps maximensis]|nr:hypothetical protein E4U21_001594 [Claviceps maximensis]
MEDPPGGRPSGPLSGSAALGFLGDAGSGSGSGTPGRLPLDGRAWLVLPHRLHQDPRRQCLHRQSLKYLPSRKNQGDADGDGFARYMGQPPQPRNDSAFIGTRTELGSADAPTRPRLQ